MRDSFFGMEASTIFIAFCSLLYLLMGKRLPRYEQRRTFLLLILDVLISAVFSFTFQIVLHSLHLRHYELRMTLMSVYYGVHIFLPPLFFHYTLLMDGTLYKYPRKYRFVIYLPNLIPIVLLIINGFHPFLFDITEDVELVQMMIYPLFLVGIIYLLLSIMDFIHRSSLLRRRDKIAYFAALAVYITSFILQFYLTELRIELLGAISALLILEILSEADGSLSSPTSGVLSSTAFKGKLSQFLALHIPCEIISARIANLSVAYSILGLNKSTALARKMGERLFFLHKCEDIFTYQVEDDRFVFLILGGFEKNRKTIYEGIQNTVDHPDQVLGVPFRMEAMVMDLKVPEDATSLSEVMALFRNERTLPVRKSLNLLPREGVEDLKKDLKILSAVRRKIERKEIEVYYQPIYSVEEKRVVAAEALLRLKDEELGYLRPDKVVHLAEHNNLISALDQAVLDKVCTFLESGKPQKEGISYLEVNLSLYEMLSPHLSEQYLAILQKHHVPVNRINLEFLETADSNFPVFEERKKALKDAGFSLSLDDFGTEYSNMERLFTNDFRNIKIDKGLLWNAMKDKNTKELLSSLISMLRKMGFNVIQEGVENKEQLDFVSSCGANLIQGYYFSSALPEEDFLEYLQHFSLKQE